MQFDHIYIAIGVFKRNQKRKFVSFLLKNGYKGDVDKAKKLYFSS